MQRILIPLLLMTNMPLIAVSATLGHGHVKMQGAIVDTACAIATGEADQSVSMGTLSFSELVNHGRGHVVPLTIHLVNCVLNGPDVSGVHHWKDVRITFSGKADGPRRFALQGNGRGEALVIADSHGVEAEPGEAMPPTSIEPGNMALRYRLWLTGNQQKMRPGHFNTTIRYFMEYE
ncbi:fimbrial protein [Pseudescherichia vulneris]